MSSFPVPLSPVIRTVESVSATFRTRERTSFVASLTPMKFSRLPRPRARERRLTFSLRTLVSSRARSTSWATSSMSNGFVM